MHRDKEDPLPRGGTDATVQLGRGIRVPVGTARESETARSVRAWQNQRYAEDWYSDAISEARIVDDHNARRREIVFAVCFAESYLFEWTMIDVLGRDFESLSDYFPARPFRPVGEKWKEVPRQLQKSELIPEVPATGDGHGVEWKRLLQYRNGLVHASASRPSTDNMPDGLIDPVPSRSDLNELDPGWAVNVVVERVVRLHRAAGTDPPPWLRKTDSGS